MLSFIAAAVASCLETPRPPRTSAFDTVDSFVAYLADNGGSVAGDSLSDAEFEIAMQAEKTGLVSYHESTWGASDVFYLA